MTQKTDIFTWFPTKDCLAISIGTYDKQWLLLFKILNVMDDNTEKEKNVVVMWL